MQTYYAQFGTCASHILRNGSVVGFNGVSGSMEIEAENRAHAFLQLYHKLSEDHQEITVQRTTSQGFVLGFTAEEWDAISKEPIRIKEGIPEIGGVQIQAIIDTPIEYRN